MNILFSQSKNYLNRPMSHIMVFLINGYLENKRMVSSIKNLGGIKLFVKNGLGDIKIFMRQLYGNSLHFIIICMSI